MKITIVLGAFLPVPPIMGGAVEKVWFALGQEFARRGHEVVQISRALSQFPRAEMIQGVQHIRVPGFDAPASLLKLKLLDLVYSLRAWRALPAADVLVTNTFWLPILLRNARSGRVYVHVARFPKGQMRFYQHCARLQAPSQPVARAVVQEIPSAAPKVTVIPYPRPNIGDSVHAPFAARERRIIYVGRIHPEKGVHLLVDAFASGFQGAERWKLVIIGPWQNKFGGAGESYWDELQSAAKKANNRIEFRGPIFDAVGLEREFRGARLFVYPSLAEKGETFGLAPLEAMTHGCPVLVSDLACFRDFVRDGETGFIFDHRTADPAGTLQTKIANLLNDEASLARVAEAGRIKSDEYSLPRVADQFLRDFRSMTVNGEASSC